MAQKVAKLSVYNKKRIRCIMDLNASVDARVPAQIPTTYLKAPGGYPVGDCPEACYSPWGRCELAAGFDVLNCIKASSNQRRRVSKDRGARIPANRVSGRSCRNFGMHCAQHSEPRTTRTELIVPSISARLARKFGNILCFALPFREPRRCTECFVGIDTGAVD